MFSRVHLDCITSKCFHRFSFQIRCYAVAIRERIGSRKNRSRRQQLDSKNIGATVLLLQLQLADLIVIEECLAVGFVLECRLKYNIHRDLNVVKFRQTSMKILIIIIQTQDTTRYRHIFYKKKWCRYMLQKLPNYSTATICQPNLSTSYLPKYYKKKHFLPCNLTWRNWFLIGIWML